MADPEIEKLCSMAISRLESAIDKRPSEPRSQTHATIRAIVELRDLAIDRFCSGGERKLWKDVLDKANAAISQTDTVEYPLSGFECEMVGDVLERISA